MQGNKRCKKTIGEGYYKPIKTNHAFYSNYYEYQSKEYKNKT